METSILVAKIMGVAYVTLGLGLIINGAYYKKAFEEIIKSPGFMFLGGIMALVAGFLIVNVHNFWVKDWTVLVTIIGWLALIKGVLIFLLPNVLISISKPLVKNPMIIGVFAVILGGVFGYFGFFA
ncbi:MAG: hypothetical protein V1679_01855 [Candidatus Peregrinibacteria bacterium]